MLARTTVLGALAILAGACQGEKKSAGESASAAAAATGGTGTGTGTGTGSVERPAADAGLDPKERDARIATYLAAVDRACESGVESSCWFQGIVYARGLLGQKADQARAREYFERGCKADLGGPSCPEVLAAKKRLTKKDRASLEAACVRGRVDACRLWGGATADFYRCNAGVLEACSKADAPADTIPKDEPVSPGLPDGAKPIAKKAASDCDAGSGLGCALLARAYLEGTHGLAADPKRALELGTRGCKREAVTLGCYPAAAARLETTNTARDTSAALDVARIGCQRGDMKACAIIAEALERSADLESRQRGLSFWLMACHLDPDQPEACASFERAVPGAVK